MVWQNSKQTFPLSTHDDLSEQVIHGHYVRIQGHDASMTRIARRRIAADANVPMSKKCKLPKDPWRCERSTATHVHCANPGPQIADKKNYARGESLLMQVIRGPISCVVFFVVIIAKGRAGSRGSRGHSCPRAPALQSCTGAGRNRGPRLSWGCGDRPGVDNTVKQETMSWSIISCILPERWSISDLCEV